MTQLSKLLREFREAEQTEEDITNKARRAVDRAVQRAVQDEVNRRAAALRIPEPIGVLPAATRVAVPACLRRIT